MACRAEIPFEKKVLGGSPSCLDAAPDKSVCDSKKERGL